MLIMQLGRVPGERTNKVEIVQMLQRLVDQRNEQQEQTSRSHDDDPRPGTSSASGSSSAGFYDDDDVSRVSPMCMGTHQQRGPA